MEVSCKRARLESLLFMIVSFVVMVLGISVHEYIASSISAGVFVVSVILTIILFTDDCPSTDEH